MQYKYIELSYTMPADAARQILAEQSTRGVEDPQVTFFSDEGGVVVAVNVQGDGMRDNHALTLATDLAWDWMYDYLAGHEVDVDEPWSMKLMDRDRMADYFQLVANQAPMPPCRPADDDGLEGAGV